MKIRIPIRLLKNMGPAKCRCCDRLSWKDLKTDRQAIKEAANDVEYVLTRKAA